MSKLPWAQAGRLTLTVAILAAAVYAGRTLWTRYQLEPWTRDGRISADVVEIAPDVGGLVTKVAVRHDQPIARGDVLFEVDRARYDLALRQAVAAVASQRTALDEARREANRNAALGDLVPQEALEQSRSRVDSLVAALDQAEAARDGAALNLAHSIVR